MANINTRTGVSVHTEEEKRKISKRLKGNQINKGRIPSLETREKISIASKKMWAERKKLESVELFNKQLIVEN